jgi:hypothetical protein
MHEDSELKTDHPVKTQTLHKVFLFYPECSQLKKKKTPHLAILGQKRLTVLEIHFRSKYQINQTKKYSPFLSHNDKG